MRLNLRLMKASSFLQQFKLDVCYKLNKEHIIPDALSQFASTNTYQADLQHLELDALFTYNATLVKIYLILVSQILAGYKMDPWLARLQ